MKRSKDRLHRVIIIGATPSGTAAASVLGDLGIPVTLIDSDTNIDKKLADEKWTLNSGIKLNYAHRPSLISILRNPAIKCILPAKIDYIKHSSQGFRVGVIKEQTFVDAQQCTLCGRCVELCPVLTQSGQKAISVDSRGALPGKAYIDKRKIPLCRQRCPLGVNTQGYIALAGRGKFAEALELIRQENILPGICGRICTHPCEEDCRRKKLDDSVSIKNIKRFLADWGLSNQKNFAKTAEVKKRKERVAIIGSGPSGLAGAAMLAKFGVEVTVFEKEKEVGGLLRYAIGPYRLPRDILNQEIKYIEKLGVKFETSANIDLKNGIETLKLSFDAIIICTGTWQDRMLDIEGKDLKSIEGCIDFLSGLHRNTAQEIKGKTAVIGDGNAAFDLARTLLRRGVDTTVLSWFSKDCIPGDPHEVQEAKKEGIKIINNVQVAKFIGKKGELCGLQCIKTIEGKPDKNGIPWPVAVKNSEPFEMQFDHAFVAIGQKGSFSKQDCSLKLTKAGYIETDDKYHTNTDKVYAAGDTVSGPSSVVEAMACGKAAAKQILIDICKIVFPEPAKRTEKDFVKISANIPTRHREPMEEIQVSGRKDGFAEVELGLLEKQVIYEAERCLQCAVCSECLQCAEICPAINHFDTEENLIEHAGALIIADPDITPQIKGDDVIRAYGSKSSSDVYAMLLKGFAAAAKSMILLSNTSQSRRGRGVSFSHPEPGLSKDIRIGVFVCKCSESMGWSHDMDEYVEQLISISDVIHCEIVSEACTPSRTANIIRTVREKGITRIVLASCVCCPLNFVCCACTDQKSRLKHNLFTATGISRAMVETCNIRGEALSLMKDNPYLAEEKFKGLIKRAIKRARKLKPFYLPVRTYNFTTAVIGSSEAAISSAVTLADAGKEVFFFGERNDSIASNDGLHIFEGFTVKNLHGTLGDFQISIQKDGEIQTIQAGAVILGEKTRKNIEYIHQERFSKAIAASSIAQKPKPMPFLYPGMTSIAGLFLADPPGVSISKKQKGEAAAALAAAIMPHGPRQSKGFTATIDQTLCRGCGRCMDVCPYNAVSFKESSKDGLRYAYIDEAFCMGCGNCISVCPSNAADKPYRNQSFLQELLEEVLLQ